MSGLAASFSSGDVALSAATAKTVVQLAAPANQRLMVTSFTISCDGVSPTDVPVKVRMLVQSSAGTMSAGTEVLQA